MSLGPDEFRDLRAGELTIDALRMELRRAALGEVVYSGPGQIRQTRDGKIEYVLFDARTDKGFGLDDIPIPGTWVESDRFLTLYARDWRGREWTGDRTEPDTSNVVGQPGVVCKGELHEITVSTSGRRNAGEFISLFAPGDGETPYNRVTRIETDTGGRKSYQAKYNVWEVNGPDYLLRVTQDDDGLEVEASRADGLFPEHFDSRLMEALWFVLARPVEWQIRTRSNTSAHQITIRRRPRPVPSPRLRPPLEFWRDREAAEPCGEMLLKYLACVGRYDEPRFHPTSVNIRQTLLASATNIETEALALGIAVESFIRRECKELGTPESRVIRAIEAALEFWEQWTGPSDLKDRIKTAVSNIKGTNPRESMNKLVDTGVLEPVHRTAWNKLRNTTAHGMDFGGSLRQVVDWCDLTHAALLRLIFSRIGYVGPYTDRSTAGWPKIDFHGGTTGRVADNGTGTASEFAG